jgi:2-phospho-L-lactate guanylyltransferase
MNASTRQGTISSFDETTHEGTVLLDDGTPQSFPASAFTLSGLRLLRLGQRVRIDRDAAGSITKITILTLN